MFRMTEARKKILLPFVLLALVFLIPSLGFGQEEKKDTRPERVHRCLSRVFRGHRLQRWLVRMDLIMDNGGQRRDH
jgi:hypothetical protein